MDIPLTGINGIGPARLKALNAAGIYSVRDLIMLLPREYRDMDHITRLFDVRAGDIAAVRVTVAGEVSQRRVKKLLITRVYVTDDTDVMPVVFYNQPWLRNQLKAGRELTLYGRFEVRGGYLQLSSPSIVTETGIVPVYRRIAGIPERSLRQAMAKALSACEGQWKDDLPQDLRSRYGLCERNFAMLNAHFPQSKEALAVARRRLAFEELLIYQVALGVMRNVMNEGVVIDSEEADEAAFWSSLPFAPTNAQRRVLSEAANDMRSTRPMARLIQGDVGSGKTAIAFGCIYLACKAGYQAALMAPTEVLAHQHFETAKAILEPLGIIPMLLTGALPKKEADSVRNAISSGECMLAIGTHALISKSVTYKNLGLVITDEQHRFGVRQRAMLSDKGESVNVLVMSATPIPRTLALILYGDLDISLVDELPPGRTPVKTRIVPESKREAMYEFVRKDIKSGGQAYVVCPLIEESEALDAMSAERIYADISTKWLPELRTALVHGRMKPAEKDGILEAFKRGEIDVLVSTTVIEVGVNVPNASIMIIENAERFGLAQLHQLRGRVGRGTKGSWCFLMSEPSERLTLLTRTSDGFIIAEKDMQIRGSGELLGFRQSGIMTGGISALATDTALLKLTHDEARNILKTPETEDSRNVIALAKEVLSKKLEGISFS